MLIKEKFYQCNQYSQNLIIRELYS